MHQLIIVLMLIALLVCVDCKQKHNVPLCVSSYAEDLRMEYHQMSVLPDEDWPPSVGRHESNLALIQVGRDALPGAKEAEQMQRDYVGGKVDRILELKKEIDYDEIFKFEGTDAEEAKKHFKMLLDGAPGVGKSVLSRRFCKDWANGRILKQFVIVKLLHLRDEDVAKASSVQDLFQFWDEFVQKEILKHIMKMKGEGVLLICDGLDELSEKERTKKSLFLDIIRGKVLCNCSVIVTSRPYASLKLQQMSCINRHVEVVGFTEKQIEDCIHRNITNEHKAARLIDQLHQRLDVFSLCYIPLNCAIMLYVYKQEDYQLPATLTQLYLLYVLHALKRSAEIHFDDLERDEVNDLRELSDPIKPPFEALCLMAYSGLQDDQLGFNTSQLPETLQAYPGFKGMKPELLGLMSATKSFSGSGSKVSYQFTHLTVQEFLAAWFASTKLSVEEQRRLFQEKLEDDRFKMMFLFLAGITGLKDEEVYEQLFHKLVHVRQLDLPENLHLPEKKLKQIQSQIKKEHEENRNSLIDTHLFFLAHLIYECQNSSLSPVLANLVAEVELSLEFKDLFHCTVLTHFLLTSNISLEFLHLKNLTCEKMRVIHQVCCDYREVKGGSDEIQAVDEPTSTIANSLTFLKDSTELRLDYTFKRTTPPPNVDTFLYLLSIKQLSTIRILIHSPNFKPSESVAKELHNTSWNKAMSNCFMALVRNKTLKRMEIFGVSSSLQPPVQLTGVMVELKDVFSANSSLQHHALHQLGLTDLAMAQISVGIANNHSLKTLDVSKNLITGQGAVCLFEALVNNDSLESLNVSYSKLSGSSASTSVSSALQLPSQIQMPGSDDVGSALAMLLLHNSVLCTLHISRCAFTPQWCTSLFKALEQNSSLKRLIMNKNKVDELSSESLARMLSKNQSLVELEVIDCDCQPKALASGLLHNTTLNTVTIKDPRTKAAIIAALEEMRKEDQMHDADVPDLVVVRCKRVIK